MRRIFFIYGSLFVFGFNLWGCMADHSVGPTQDASPGLGNEIVYSAAPSSAEAKTEGETAAENAAGKDVSGLPGSGENVPVHGPDVMPPLSDGDPIGSGSPYVTPSGNPSPKKGDIEREVP